MFTPSGHIYQRNMLSDLEEVLHLNFEDVECVDLGNESDIGGGVDRAGYTEGDGDIDDLPPIDLFSTSGIYSVISEGTYVAIKAPVGSLEFFHVMKVLEKGVAAENMNDSSHEHFISKGETYLVGKWMSFQHEGKRFAQYKEAKNVLDALINVAEVFYTNVEFNEQLQLDINQYCMLCCSF